MKKKLFGTILIILIITLLMTSCDFGNSGESTTADTTHATGEADIDLSEYKIIRPDNGARVEVEAALFLKNKITELCSVTLAIDTDWSPNNTEENPKEILIGNTSYSQTAEVIAQLNMKDYAIAMYEGRIVITGGSPDTTYSAVEYFLENYIDFSGKKPILKSRENYTMKYDYLYQELNLKVVSLNVLTATSAIKNQQGEREPRIVSFVNEYQPDSMGVQECEVFWRMRLDSVLDGYARAQEVTTVTKNYIYYRKDKLKVVDSGVFWLSETPELSSKGFGSNYYISCCWAIFESLENGSRYVHMNTHLDVNSEEIREKELTVLLPRAQQFIDDGYAVILTGDFNSLETSIIYSKITATDLKSSRYLTRDSSSMGTFNGLVEKTVYKGPIDYCFVNKEVSVDKYRVIVKQDDGFMSDHNALYIEMKVYPR